MLQLGSSKPWPDAMEIMTGQRKMDATAILEYFKPLNDWLVTENKRLKVHIGWKKSDSEYLLYLITLDFFYNSYIFRIFMPTLERL